MSFALGESASAGTIFCDKLVAKDAGDIHEIKGDLQVDGQLTQVGISTFENTVNLLSGANLTANGQVAIANANIFMFDLPTTDPAVAGKLFRTGTQVHVSLG
jgi:hypothetical protein